MPGSKERIPTERIVAALKEVNGLISLAAKRVPCSPAGTGVRRCGHPRRQAT
jgi:hypothetical protein